MFQRIRGAIDRTIAEEQARQKALTEQQPAASSRAGSLSRSASNTSQAKGPRTRKVGQEASRDTVNGDTGENPDPAVFEAAFVIDDTEDTSRGPSPKPPTTENDTTETDKAGSKKDETEQVEDAANVAQNGDKNSSSRSQNAVPTPTAKDSTPLKIAAPGVPPDMRSKLRKLEKLEATYPELLRSYRIAHSRATSIEAFEKALRENTPLTSIKDPNAFVEYLSQLSLKTDMVMDELKRVSAEKDTFKKKCEEAATEAASLREELAAVKAAKLTALPGDETTEDSSLERAQPEPEQDRAVLDGSRDEGPDDETSQDLFSYDNEIPKLQAEVGAKSEQIDSLRADISTLEKELATAKETSLGLIENLERATRELSEARDAVRVQESLKTQLDARDNEIASVNDRLSQSQAQMKDLTAQLDNEKRVSAAAAGDRETKLAETVARMTELETEIRESSEAKTALGKKIEDLMGQIEALQIAKLKADQKIDELTKQLQAGLTPSVATAEPLDTTAAPSAPKKNNKKKKKKGGAGMASMAVAPTGEASDRPPPSPLETSATAELQSQIASLKLDMSKKDEQIERLQKQRKTEEDLRDEIETLQENLLNIGQDHVEAKEKIKALESERAALQMRITELEKEMETAAMTANTSAALQKDFESLKGEYEDLKMKSSILQSDLRASQQLAQSRYKDLTDLREVLQKAQPELKSLRQEAVVLKTTKEELAAKTADLRAMEKREKELKAEITRAQRLGADREAEVKALREKLSAETSTRLRLEDAQRVSGRDLRKAEAEKIELSAREEKASRELQRLQEEVANVKPRIAELEAEAAKLRKETVSLREEAELKTSQYVNAQNLLGSMRDQTAELSIQLKESQAQAESLDEELAECRKLLGERTREAETMRRLLADVDERADSKVREMRARLDAALEERDRLEDESSSIARRKTRETEELRQKIRDLERETKALSTEKDDLEHREREWRRRREELEAVEQKTDAELIEMRSTVSNLRATLDASEQQVREAEKAKTDLRRMLDDYRIRYDKLAKEAKALQVRVGNTVSNSGRSSMDSGRSGGANGANAGAGGQQLASADAMYLKTIMLQFLEQKDNKLRAQLVPVLGKLLKFDRSEEQKWIAAVQHMGAR
ncbi:Golgin IMH1 [Pleurostoma richardsiae]|uniref:Golgin IMH1 n=1 Tax=Pleurostoma richardsiae TaxID=41990 RepID=A0AA38VDG1_9PEZI|nr:Golgin IMH1 [Pleurostoma richardsiae]